VAQREQGQRAGAQAKKPRDRRIVVVGQGAVKGQGRKSTDRRIVSTSEGAVQNQGRPVRAGAAGRAQKLVIDGEVRGVEVIVRVEHRNQGVVFV
jgi:hypothetical protein